MKKMLIIGAALAAMCAIPALCQMSPPAGGPQGGPQAGLQGRPGAGGAMGTSLVMAVMPPQARMFDRMSASLALTEDQAAQIKALLTTTDASLKSLNTKLADATTALRTSLTAAEYDAQNVKELAAKAEKAEADVVSASIDAWTKLRAILTADQIAKLKTTMGAQHGPGPGQGMRQHQGQRPSAPPTGEEGFPPPAPPQE